MPLNWTDVSSLSINTLLLLERVQISWFPAFHPPPAEFATVLRAHPALDWFLRHKCPEISGWLDNLLAQQPDDVPDLRQAEIAMLRRFEDLLVYVYDPSIYDAQSFLQWDDRELTDLVDFAGKTVIDVGSGTGRLALAVGAARTVFAVEPVENLRRYILEKAEKLGLKNIYTVDGLITAIPFPDGFADVTMGGHVFGDDPAAERAELERVTAPGGLIILCPGNNDRDDAKHDFLVASGYAWSRFEEPGSAMVRKYWKVKGPS